MAKSYVAYIGPIVKQCVAREAAEKFYFTGRPCKNGHLSQRTTIGGACPDCRRTSFKIDPNKKRVSQGRYEDANRDKIRERTRKYSKEHREQANAWASIPANRAKKNAAARARHELVKATTDPEELRARGRLKYARNPQAHTARSLRWQATNPDVLKQYRIDNADAIKRRSAEWANANPEKVRANVRKYQLAHPETGKNWKKANPAAVKAIKQNRRARERNAEGRHTAAEIKAMFERQNGQCIYCQVSITNGYEADHIQPLARGGSNWISNIQLLCRSCNNAKRATDPIEYERRIGRAA